MKQYYVFKICEEPEDTERKLNELAKDGWILICSYARYNHWLIMEKEIDVKVCTKCKRELGEK